MSDRVPDYPPAPRHGLVDRLAVHLPIRLGALALTLEIRHRPVQPGIEVLTPWITLTVGEWTQRLVRLPGVRVVELWDVAQDRWILA